VAFWAASDSMVRLSTTPQAAIFWNPFIIVATSFMAVAMYMFALAYTGSRRNTSLSIFPLLGGVSALFIFLDSRTHLITDYVANTVRSTPWGFVLRTGPAYLFFVSWIVLLGTASLILISRYSRNLDDERLRRQTRLFMIAIIIPFSIGTVTNGILPALNIVAVPEMAVILLTLTGIIISYGTLKLNLFRFSPEMIASRILNTINDGVIGLTAEGRISYANMGASRLFGVPIESLSYRSLEDFVADIKNHPHLQQQLTEQLAKTDFFTLDSVDFRTADGKIISTKLSVTKIIGSLDSYGYLVVLVDITEISKSRGRVEEEVNERTLQLHEEQARLWASIEALKDGFALATASNTIVVQNLALSKIFNLPERVLTIEQLQHQLKKIDLVNLSREVQRTGQPIHLNRINLGLKTLQIFMGPVRVAEQNRSMTIGTVLLVEDITEAVIQERSRDEFFSIASHELRTPLTSIRGNSSMILSYYQDMLKDQQLKEMIEDIHISSVRLIGLVNDFLDVSRLEQKKMNFSYTSVPIGTVIESVASEMKNMLSSKNTELKLDEAKLQLLPPVWVDKNRIEQVIYNLIGNAAKFTDSGFISIKGHLVEDDKFVKILVEDSGRGMSPSAQKLLFRKFQQTGQSLLTRDTTRGTGLGLYISKMIIETMGGQIVLESSTEGQGSTFSFTVPVATPERRAMATQTDQPIDTVTGMSSAEE
jgi:PAS domain S-box-containing protein